MLRALALAALALPPQEKPDEPKLHAVKKGKLVPAYALEGTVEAAEAAELKVRAEAASGEFALLRVVPSGSAVKKGDEVLALDPAPFRRQVEAAETELRVARAALAKAAADLELGGRSDALALARAEAEAADAQTALRVFDEVEGKHLVEQAELSVKMNRDRVKDQEEELDQLRKMYKSEELTNATAEIVVRRAERALDQTRTFLRMAEESAVVVRTVKHPQQRRGLQAAVEEEKAALASLKAAHALSLVQREAELAKAKAAAERAEEQLAKLRKDLEASVFRAPFDGRAFYGEFQQGHWPSAEQAAKSLRPGEKLQPGQVYLTVCGLRARVRAELPESGYFDVPAGRPAAVLPAALPGLKLAAEVREKLRVASPKPPGAAFALLVEFAEARTDLLPGMKARVELSGEELRDVLLVPAEALEEAEGKHTVKVSREGKVEPREVTVGRSDGKQVQVTGGLEAGETIVLPK